MSAAIASPAPDRPEIQPTGAPQAAELRPRDYGANPWNAAGLEWQTASPPITQNLLRTPEVNHEACNYKEIDAELRART